MKKFLGVLLCGISSVYAANIPANNFQLPKGTKIPAHIKFGLELSQNDTKNSPNNLMFEVDENSPLAGCFIHAIAYSDSALHKIFVITDKISCINKKTATSAETFINATYNNYVNNSVKYAPNDKVLMDYKPNTPITLTLNKDLVFKLESPVVTAKKSLGIVNQ